MQSFAARELVEKLKADHPVSPCSRESGLSLAEQARIRGFEPRSPFSTSHPGPMTDVFEAPIGPSLFDFANSAKSQLRQASCIKSPYSEDKVQAFVRSVRKRAFMTPLQTRAQIDGRVEARALGVFRSRRRPDHVVPAGKPAHEYTVTDWIETILLRSEFRTRATHGRLFGTDPEITSLAYVYAGRAIDSFLGVLDHNERLARRGWDFSRTPSLELLPSIFDVTALTKKGAVWYNNFPCRFGVGEGNVVALSPVAIRFEMENPELTELMSGYLTWLDTSGVRTLPESYTRLLYDAYCVMATYKGLYRADDTWALIH